VVEVWAFHRRDPSRAAGRPMLLAVHQAAGRVEAIDLPQEIAQVVPPELLRAGLRALGKARVDVAGRRAEAAVSPGEGIPTVPTLDAVMAVLGPPDELQVHAQGGTRAIWRYTLTSRPTVPVALALDVRPGASRPSRVIVSVNGLWGYLDLP